jgi:inhibitor of cysteine peptidase
MRSVRRAGYGLGLALVCLASTAMGRADEPKPVKITDKDNDGKVLLVKGQELIVTLDITTGTGYTWLVKRVDDKQLEQTGKPKEEREENKPGAPARLVFRFKALKPGTTPLELDYKRPFEKEAKPAKTFQVKVTIKEAE